MKNVKSLVVMLGILLVAGSAPADRIELEGAGTGRSDRPYPVPGRTVPLLEQFFLLYYEGHGVDRHVNTIMVMPGGEAQDESPNAGLGMPVVEDGQVAIILQDKNADDSYFFDISHHPVANVQRHNIRDVGCVGRCERQLPHPLINARGNVFVLVGFQIFFTGGRDHRVDRIGVYVRNGKLIVELNDKNDDDVFGYSVDYVLLPRLRVRETDTFTIGTAGVGSVLRTVQVGDKVIRGFLFDFTGGPDMRLSRIAAGFLGLNSLLLAYSDDSFTSNFSATIDYAVLAPPLEVDPDP